MFSDKHIFGTNCREMGLINDVEVRPSLSWTSLSSACLLVSMPALHHLAILLLEARLTRHATVGNLQ